ncbi:MAG: ABC transporter ATP-binding protein [Myxococcales bacterium]|nr:ABC transporter ATP-binding protein [Myxococcales bacterium]
MIVVDKVSKYYGAKAAVLDLQFEIGRGECVGFLGLNGAGKSTTLRLLSCLLLPTSGRIRVRDFDVVDNPHEIRQLIGYLPDSPPLYPEMTVDEYLHFAGRLRGLEGKALDDGRARALELCALGDMTDAPIATLSHGYRQRVGIAQAIIHRPALLILDEPTQGLDPLQIVEMRSMIGELRGEHTILLSTHILTEIEQTCDRILMMHKGRIAAEGSEQELAERMSRGRRLQLEVKGAEASVRQALEALEGVSDLKVAAAAAASAEELEVSMVLSDDGHRAAVSRAVMEAGVDLLGMRSVSSGLEAVFVELSRAAAPESVAQGAPGGAEG